LEAGKTFSGHLARPRLPSLKQRIISEEKRIRAAELFSGETAMARPEPFLSSPGHEKTPVASVPFPATFVEEVS